VIPFPIEANHQHNQPNEETQTVSATNKSSKHFEPFANDDDGASIIARSWLIELGQGDCRRRPLLPGTKVSSQSQ
jgi:hypothetical protein